MPHLIPKKYEQSLFLQKEYSGATNTAHVDASTTNRNSNSSNMNANGSNNGNGKAGDNDECPVSSLLSLATSTTHMKASNSNSLEPNQKNLKCDTSMTHDTTDINTDGSSNFITPFNTPANAINAAATTKVAKIPFSDQSKNINLGNQSPQQQDQHDDDKNNQTEEKETTSKAVNKVTPGHSSHVEHQASTTTENVKTNNNANLTQSPVQSTPLRPTTTPHHQQSQAYGGGSNNIYPPWYGFPNAHNHPSSQFHPPYPNHVHPVAAYHNPHDPYNAMRYPNFPTTPVPNYYPFSMPFFTPSGTGTTSTENASNSVNTNSSGKGMTPMVPPLMFTPTPFNMKKNNKCEPTHTSKMSEQLLKEESTVDEGVEEKDDKKCVDTHTDSNSNSNIKKRSIETNHQDEGTNKTKQKTSNDDKTANMNDQEDETTMPSMNTPIEIPPTPYTNQSSSAQPQPTPDHYYSSYQSTNNSNNMMRSPYSSYPPQPHLHPMALSHMPPPYLMHMYGYPPPPMPHPHAHPHGPHHPMMMSPIPPGYPPDIRVMGNPNSNPPSSTGAVNGMNMNLPYPHNGHHPHYPGFGGMMDGSGNRMMMDHNTSSNNTNNGSTAGGGTEDDGDVPSRGQNIKRCVQLVPPITLKIWSEDEIKNTKIPDFPLLVNYPVHFHRYRSAEHHSDRRRCVMCGESRYCASALSEAGALNESSSSSTPSSRSKHKMKIRDSIHIIPKQNKGLCTACDVAVWVIQETAVEIKWCKGCKNFRAWAAFGDKGLATKCWKCRERQRGKYKTQKSKKKSSSSSDENSNSNNNNKNEDGNGKENVLASPQNHGLSCLIAATTQVTSENA